MEPWNWKCQRQRRQKLLLSKVTFNYWCLYLILMLRDSSRSFSSRKSKNQRLPPKPANLELLRLVEHSCAARDSPVAALLRASGYHTASWLNQSEKAQHININGTAEARRPGLLLPLILSARVTLKSTEKWLWATSCPRYREYETGIEATNNNQHKLTCGRT